MGEIKSAREIAMEKVKDLGDATEEERLRWKYVPEGSRLAAIYMSENVSLLSALSKYNEKDKDYVLEGLSEVLVRNIGLPENEMAKKKNKRAMEGLKAVKKDQIGLENIYSNIRRIFEHYQETGKEQKKQAYKALKDEFESQVKQALQQQLGSLGGMKIDVEKQPQFQSEWRRRQAQLDSEYLSVLDELKRELAVIT
jgi:putative protein kinase ArgK-like GTPase of G3E family